MRDHLIDRIIPKHAVHLVGGPSGSNKTTMLLQLLVQEWSKGRPVFGNTSHPVPWVYISADRPSDSVWETMERIGIPKDSVRIYSVVDHGKVMDIESVIKECLTMTPRPELVVIEGLASLMKGSYNNYQHVAKLLTLLTLICTKEQITIIGVVHSTKTKQGEEFLNPRQRVMGSVAWAAYSETILLLEPLGLEKDSTTNLRRLFVLPRNSKEFSIDFQLDANGRLTAIATEKEDDLAEALVLVHTQTMKPNETFSTADFVFQVEQLGYKKRTAEKILTKFTEEGIFTQIGKGRYRKVNGPPTSTH